MNIKIINLSKHPLPSYETGASAGMNLRAGLDHPVTLKSLERTLIPTGLFMELPVGFEAQIRPRCGMALKKGISLVNIPGTIGADYRGVAEWIQVEELKETERDAGGFGHTGIK